MCVWSKIIKRNPNNPKTDVNLFPEPDGIYTDFGM